ncbi:hypothetical protein GCM10023331_27350 [Algivirga pacifica]|uniref:Uncharacterized protein n=2 Tax=Algivirga pacifica TaxID=1162670 RepID=A0ABP9DDM2_9BACT
MAPTGNLYNLFIAIAYAQQAAQRTIEPEAPLDIQNIRQYNLHNPGFDAWEQYIRIYKKLRGNRIRTKDVAAGMMAFSLDPCSEYLMDQIGINRIEQEITKLPWVPKQTYHYPVSGKVVGFNPTQVSPEQYIRTLPNTSNETFGQMSEEVHQNLQKGYTSIYDSLLINAEQYHKEYLMLWYDRAPHYTPEVFLKTLHHINRRTYFSKEVFRPLIYALESTPMKSPEIQRSFSYCGFLSSSTPTSLSIAIYGKTKSGQHVELVCVFQQLSRKEHIDLSALMHDFAFELIEEPIFREKIQSLLSK